MFKYKGININVDFYQHLFTVHFTRAMKLNHVMFIKRDVPSINNANEAIHAQIKSFAKITSKGNVSIRYFYAFDFTLSMYHYKLQDVYDVIDNYLVFIDSEISRIDTVSTFNDTHTIYSINEKISELIKKHTVKNGVKTYFIESDIANIVRYRVMLASDGVQFNKVELNTTCLYIDDLADVL